jgi:hypothetical protein
MNPFKNTFWRGIFTGIVINLAVIIPLLTSTSHDLRYLEFIRGSIRFSWLISLMGLVFIWLLTLWIGGKKISFSVQDDDLPPKTYPFLYVDRNSVIGYIISALVFSSLYTGYILWQYPEPSRGEKCAGIQQLYDAIQKMQVINPDDPPQIALDLDEEMRKILQDNYFLYNFIDDIHPAINGIYTLTNEIYKLKDLEEIGEANTVKIKEMSTEFANDLEPLVNKYCFEP